MFYWNLKVLLITSFLTGCSWLSPQTRAPAQPVEVVKIEIPAPVYHPVLPSKIKTMPVQWTVLTPEIMQEYVQDLEAGEAPVNVWYALTTKGYENLSQNMAEVQRYIRQVLNIVDYYKSLDDKQEETDGSTN